MLKEFIVNNEQRDSPNPLLLYSVIVSEAIKLVRLKPATLRSRAKHSTCTTEPLRPKISSSKPETASYTLVNATEHQRFTKSVFYTPPRTAKSSENFLYQLFCF